VTKAIESLNSKLNSSMDSRNRSSSGKSEIKLPYLVLRGVSKNWKMLQREWPAAKTPLVILSGNRFSLTWKVLVKPDLQAKISRGSRLGH
jgi:transposase-like protein